MTILKRNNTLKEFLKKWLLIKILKYFKMYRVYVEHLQIHKKPTYDNFVLHIPQTKCPPIFISKFNSRNSGFDFNTFSLKSLNTESGWHPIESFIKYDTNSKFYIFSTFWFSDFLCLIVFQWKHGAFCCTKAERSMGLWSVWRRRRRRRRWLWLRHNTLRI